MVQPHQAFPYLAVHPPTAVRCRLVFGGVMKRMIERKTADNTVLVFGENTSTLLGFCNFVSKYDDALYELSRLMQIACIMPVTSVASERSFSCLKLIKTHLMTTMLYERLSSLAVLSMYSERVNELDFENVIDRFALQYPHCRIQLTL